jgi:uncharacterized membrane protein YwzB
MGARLILYIFSSIVVIWSIDSVNINAIFKKNKIAQAKVFYFVLALCLTELLTSFLYNLFETVNFL